jgi:hypothetical protein
MNSPNSAKFPQNHVCIKLTTATVIQTIVRIPRLFSGVNFFRLLLFFISIFISARTRLSLSSFAPILCLLEIEEDPRERDIDELELPCSSFSDGFGGLALEVVVVPAATQNP